MQCRKCKAEIGDTDIQAVFAAHDINLIDIIIICPECGSKLNYFVSEGTLECIDDLMV